MADATADQRLAEMDARLRAIALELERDLGPLAGSRPVGRSRRAPRIFPPAAPVDPPVREPERPAPGQAGAGAAGVPPDREPDRGSGAEALEAMAGRLVAALRELLAGYEVALGALGALGAGEPGTGTVTLAAGPFAGVAGLQEFERALRGLPHVAEAVVRGYEGADRAILEVRLRG